MALDSYEYGDPLGVLLRKEAKTCRGCVFVSRLWGLELCRKKRDQKAGQKLKRCKDYEAKEDA